MKTRPPLDRARDTRANGAKVEALHAYNVPVYWIAVSPLECQALIEDVVPPEVQKQCVTLLAGDPV